MVATTYYHVCTKGEDLPWMFRDEFDFIAGINRIGFCVLSVNVTVVDFILMDTHVHFILNGSLPICKEFINKYKQMTGKWVSHRHNIANHLSKVATTIVPVGSEEALMEEIAYVDRNSIMAGYRCMPTEYRWGMSRYFFKDTLSMNALLAGFEKIGERSLKILKKQLSTRVDIPRDWEIDKSGMINPRCFVDYRIVESIYRSPNRYLYFLAKKLEGKIDMKLSQSVSSFIPDKEMRSITDSLTREMFGLEKKGLLNMSQRIQMAKKLRYEYGATHKQISRMLNVDVNILKGFV
jgi:hypothetical protein